LSLQGPFSPKLLTPPIQYGTRSALIWSSILAPADSCFGCRYCSGEGSSVRTEYLDHIARLDGEIARFDKRLRQLTKDDEASARLQTMPGISPITAAVIEAFAPPMATFKRGRDFAAWLGLVPRQHSTGGKPKLGQTSKMGQRDIRRLLIIGAMSVIRWTIRKGGAEGSWLARMLIKKPRLVVAIRSGTTSWMNRSAPCSLCSR